jgi:hypothetical protein
MERTDVEDDIEKPARFVLNKSSDEDAGSEKETEVFKTPEPGKKKLTAAKAAATEGRSSSSSGARATETADEKKNPVDRLRSRKPLEI